VNLINSYGFGGIYKVPSARLQWLGASAMQLLNWALKSMGLREVLLEICEDNLPAIGLNRNLGFETVGTMTAHCFDGDNYHNVVLKKRLLDQPALA
jgi:L-amino acid N-acyltransferase YncA